MKSRASFCLPLLWYRVDDTPVTARRNTCETIWLLSNQTSPNKACRNFKMVKNIALGLYREGNGKRMICKKSACHYYLV